MKGEKVAIAVGVALVLCWLVWIARPANQRDVLQANQAATAAVLEATRLRTEIGQHDQALVKSVQEAINQLVARIEKLEAAQPKPESEASDGR